MTSRASPVPLEAFLSDRPRFEWRGQPVEIESRKPQALLCYLSLQSGEVNRERLAELLWGPERLLNVRQALYQLRQLPGAEGWLKVGDNVRVEVESDVARFERAFTAEQFSEALQAWWPPLMAGMEGLRAPVFGEWLELERSRLEGLYLRVLERRSAELEREGRFSEALELVRRFLDIDPLRESAYRHAMRICYLLGDADGAMDTYRDCLRVMREELHSEPLPATVALAETIADGRTLSISVSPGNLPAGLLRILQAQVVSRGRLSTRQLAGVLDLDEFEVAEGLAGLERRLLLDRAGRVPEDAVEVTLAEIPDRLRILLHGRIADVLVGEAPEGAEEVAGHHLLQAQRPDEAAPLLLAQLERAVVEQDGEQPLLPGFRVLWCGNQKQRLEAALVMEGYCERTGMTDLQDALLQEAQKLAWELQQDQALARVDLRRSRRLMRLGDLGEAKKLANEATATASRVGATLLVAQGTNAMGAISFMEGRLDRAERYFAENEDSEVEAERYRALNNLGAVAGLRGDLAASYRYLEQTLTLARRLGDLTGIGACLNNLAATAERMADYPTATEKLREGRDLARRTGNRVHTVQTLVNLAQVHLRQGNLGPAWNTAQEALVEAAELEDVRSEAQALEQLGQIARTVGAAEESMSLLEEALERLGGGDERRVLGLQANLALSSLAGDSQVDSGAVAGHVQELEGLGANDVARWFRAELALLDRDCERVRAWSSRAMSDTANPHLRLVGEIASVRAALLAGNGTDEVAAALARGLRRLQTVETPLGHQLLALAFDSEDAARHAEVTAELLKVQGEGLPKRLRESLSRQPERWRAAVGF